MINNPTIQNKIYEDTLEKNFIITMGETTLDNENILQGSFSLSESLCSEENLAFGSCESTQVQFTIFNTDYTYKDFQGKSFTLQIEFPTLEETLDMGKFYITESTKEDDVIKITALDSMSLFDESADEWFNAYTFDNKTLLDIFKDLQTEVLGEIQVSTLPLNGDLPISKTAYTTGLTYRDVLSWIGEASASFPHFNRSSQLKMYTLPTQSSELEVPYYIPPVEYADYVTKQVTKLQVRTESNDVGIIVGEGTNTYVIESNQFMIPLDSSTLIPYATNILNQIKEFTYRPVSIEVPANPLIELGDMITVALNDTELESVTIPIFSRTMSGGQGLSDEYSIEGTESREAQSYVNREIIQLNSKYLTIKKDVEEFNVTLGGIETTISDLEETVSKLDTALISIVTDYGISDSSSVKPTEWGEYPEDVEDGKWIWSRNTYTYSNGAINYSYTPLAEQNSADNKAIQSITEEYTTTSTEDEPTAGWQTTMPEWNSALYIWQRSHIVYTDNTEEYTTPTLIKGGMGTVISETEPEDTDVFWFNTTDNKLYYFNGNQWVTVGDYSNDINDMYYQIQTEYEQAIEIVQGEINTTVSEIQTVVNETTETVTELSTSIEQTNNQVSIAINNINSITDSLNGKLDASIIANYFDFTGDGLKIHATNSDFSILLSNDELGFYQGSNKVAWINNNELHITNAFITQEIRVGKPDDYMSFVYEGQNGWSFI